MTTTPNTPPNRSLTIARTIKWAVAICLALAVLVWIGVQVRYTERQSRYGDRPPLPNAENAESHPQPAWLLDRG